MKKFFLVFFSMLVILCLASCGKGSSNTEVNTNPNEAIVYELNYEIRDEDISDEIKKVTDFIKEKGGYVKTSSEKANEKHAFASYCYKIPRSNLDAFVSFMDEIKEVESKQIDALDITSEYNQITSRIDTLKASKTAYQNMLKNDSLSMSDITIINDKITSIDSEIANLSLEKAQMDSQTTYSTIYVTYNEIYQENFFADYGSYLANLFIVLFKIFMYILPFAVIVAVIMLTIFLIEKNHKKKLEMKKEKKDVNDKMLNS